MSDFPKLVSLFVFAAIVVTCGRKVFPDDRFVFSSNFRNLITPYRIGDTLKFENSTLGIRRIRITGKDSIMTNWKGPFINERPYKLVRLYCDALDYSRANAKDTTFIFINKYPDSMQEFAHFSVMNFRGWLEGGHDSMISKFQPIQNKNFTDCFVVRNTASDLVQSNDDIEYIYVQLDDGIVALRTYRGDFWVKKE